MKLSTHLITNHAFRARVQRETGIVGTVVLDAILQAAFETIDMHVFGARVLPDLAHEDWQSCEGCHRLLPSGPTFPPSYVINVEEGITLCFDCLDGTSEQSPDDGPDDGPDEPALGDEPAPAHAPDPT